MAIKERDSIILVNEDNIPDELKKRRQFVLWKAVLNKQKGTYDKLPYQPNGQAASSTDFMTWSDFETVHEAYNTSDYDGIGFTLSPMDDYLVVDIDGLEDVNHLDDLAAEITSMSYAEISPSGTGIHVWFKAKHNKERHKNKDAKTGYEVYDSSRYMTITGESINDLPINEGGPKLDAFLDKVLKREKPTQLQTNGMQTGKAALPAGEIIKIALKSQKGERFEKFMFGGWEEDYNHDQSTADMAFANDLAFWCNKDFSTMESIFRKSSLMRDKFDRPQNASTYGTELLEKAIAECDNAFTLDEQPKKSPEWFAKNSNNTTSFLHHVLARKVMRDFHLKRFPNAHGSLYFYNTKKGVYEEDASGRIVKGLIRRYDEALKASQINEVFRFIEEVSPIIREVDFNYVAVGNGLVNFQTKQLETFNPEIFVTQKFPTNYNPAAHNAFVETTLQKVTEGYKPSIENLKEMWACVLYPDILVPRLFYLYGKSAANGKSSILNMIHQTFNRDGGNISSISPHKLSTNNFASSAMYGKACNVTDDNPDFTIQDSGDLKTFITGGYATIEKKGRDPISVRMTTPLIVASNHLPSFTENGHAISRRLHIIEFNHNFSKDRDCLSDLATKELISSVSAREYVMKLAVEKLFEMLENPDADKLTPNPKCEAILRTFEEVNDIWSDYFAEYDVEYFNKMEGVRVIDDYKTWCFNHMIPPLGNQKFKELVCGRLEMDWKDKQVEINGERKTRKGFKSKKQEIARKSASGFFVLSP